MYIQTYKRGSFYLFVYLFNYLFSVSLASCPMIKNLYTRELYIGLDEDGRLLDTSKVPSCENGENILLKSYSYKYAECSYSEDCDFPYSVEFSPKGKLKLHEMCSLQTNCRNLSFPCRDSFRKNKTNAVLIRYQCIGKSDFTSSTYSENKFFIQRKIYHADT